VAVVLLGVASLPLPLPVEAALRRAGVLVTRGRI
jgi:hypothetical protein